MRLGTGSCFAWPIVTLAITKHSSQITLSSRMRAPAFVGTKYAVPVLHQQSFKPGHLPRSTRFTDGWEAWRWIRWETLLLVTAPHQRRLFHRSLTQEGWRLIHLDN